MTDRSGLAAPPRIVLLGMMGSGKSSVGHALAALTGWPFVDNDELLRRATGRTARELLAAEGEAAMRAAESAALREGLATPPPAVVATAAGTILRPDDRARLADGGFTVWLHAPPAVLAARAAGGSHRPWLDADPEAWFTAAAAGRDRWYRAVAVLEIDTSRTDPAAAARRIRDAVSARG